MEKFALTLQSKNEIENYKTARSFMKYEKQLLDEMIALVDNKDEAGLSWFAGFGEDFRQILMNVNEYRRGLEFGFTTIAFNQYGWFESPKFLEFEEIELEQSSIRIGRGPNGLWAYALSVSYGCAGHSGPLSVFCEKFPNRDKVLSVALSEMKNDMLSKVGESDRTNFHQDVISKTLKAIIKLEINLVQLTLF